THQRISFNYSLTARHLHSFPTRRSSDLSPADYFLLANEQSAAVVRDGGAPPEKIKVFGFPVSPRFADFTKDRHPLPQTKSRVLYVINAGTRRAPDLVRKLLELDIQLTVTVGRDEKLRRAVEKAV